MFEQTVQLLTRQATPRTPQVITSLRLLLCAVIVCELIEHPQAFAWRLLDGVLSLPWFGTCVFRFHPWKQIVDGHFTLYT